MFTDYRLQITSVYFYIFFLLICVLIYSDSLQQQMFGKKLSDEYLMMFFFSGNSFLICLLIWSKDFPCGSDSKESACKAEDRLDPWTRKIPWRREWEPIAIFLPGEFYGQRSSLGYSPRGCKELDMIEQLTHRHTVRIFSLAIIRKFLAYSCHLMAMEYY